jgi:hypothetical protein
MFDEQRIIAPWWNEYSKRVGAIYKAEGACQHSASRVKKPAQKTKP